MKLFTGDQRVFIEWNATTVIGAGGVVDGANVTFWSDDMYHRVEELLSIKPDDDGELSIKPTFGLLEALRGAEQHQAVVRNKIKLIFFSLFLSFEL